jgi:hypothetical protein
MSTNKLLVILSASSLITCGFTAVEVFQLKEFNVQQSEILAIEKRKNDKHQAKAIIASEPRIANIINYKMENQNTTQITPPLIDMAIGLSHEFIDDSLDDSFYKALSSVGFSDEVVITEYGYSIRNKWTMFADKQSPFYQDFPKGSILVYNNETFPIGECRNETQITYAPLSARNIKFDADFILNEEQTKYRVSFNGNYNSIKDRIIILVSCQTNKAN